MEKTSELPSWLFDIEEAEDEQDLQTSLFQELEIDIEFIYKNIDWMISGPIFKIFGRSYKQHPLYNSSSKSNQIVIDFWGPCSVVSLYVLILWLGKVKEVLWTFLIWALGGIFNHFITRNWYHSTLLFHIALLGYSIAPMIPFAGLILITNPPLWLASIFEILGILWASSSAVISYNTIIITSGENNNKIILLYPVVIIMQLYLTSLLPVNRK